MQNENWNYLFNITYYLFQVLFWVSAISVFYFAFSGEHQNMINSLVCTMATAFVVKKIRKNTVSL